MEYGKLSALAQRVIEGTATIARLDTDEEQGRIAGGFRNVEATIVLGTALILDLLSFKNLTGLFKISVNRCHLCSKKNRIFTSKKN